MELDSVLEEVRAIRDQIAREHDYDIDSIFQAFREVERATGQECAILAPRLVAEQTFPADGFAAAER
jgi:hypothetical protein